MAEHSNTLVTVKSNLSLQTETENRVEVTDEDQNEKVFRPILVCESTETIIPHNLRSIIENMDPDCGSVTNKMDLIICVLYVLMIEVGFVPKQFKEDFYYNSVNFHKERLERIVSLPPQWKCIQTNTYKLEFVLQPYPKHVCKMVCLIINQNLTINVLVNKILKFCTQLSINKYIPIEDATPLSNKFRFLNELSNQFKDEIALVVKSAILRCENVSFANLQEMPAEINLVIFTKLPVIDCLNLMQTCRRMKESATFYETNLWRQFLARDFPYINTVAVQGSLKDRYKLEFRKKVIIPRKIRSLKRHSSQLLHFDII